MSATAAEIAALLPGFRDEAKRLTRNAADADDLLQDTAEKALRNRHSAQGNVAGWLYSVLVSSWLDRLRKAHRRHKLFTHYYLPYHAIQHECDASECVELDRLQRALVRLPPEQRIAFELHYLAGLEYGEIALIQNVPRGTIKSRVGRAKEMLEDGLFVA